MKTRLPRFARFVALFFIAALAVGASSASAQDWAKQKLDKSPRHQEWVKDQVRQPHGRTAFVVYPEVSHKAPVVLLIHEIFGLSDWARSMADDIAAMGYIVIAPDLLSGMGPNGGGAPAHSQIKQATVKAVSGLNPDTVTADLNAAADYALKFPAANGKLAVAASAGAEASRSLCHPSQRPERGLRVLRPAAGRRHGGHYRAGLWLLRGQ